MFKTFVLGIILGLLGVGSLVYFVPVVDLHREPSFITVQTNGGNREEFHINLPQDRILAGMRTEDDLSVFPEGVIWPDEESLYGAQTEVFKVRNDNDIVVGIAARVSSSSDESGPFVQWMVHLPARGSMFAGMRTGLDENGRRNGLLVAGTREFGTLSGNFSEYFNAEAKDEEYEISGRLELVTAFVAPLGEAE